MRSVLSIATFVYLWGTLGFALGTLTLLGPVRWVTAALRARDVSQGVEDWAVRAIILVLVVGTGALAVWLTRRKRDATGWRRATAPLITTVLAIGALGLWLNPRLVAGDLSLAEGDGRFVFGPYPTREDLQRLHDEGFAGVISLLHPAVAPFEPKLLVDERAAAQEVGIPLIEAPMLPWISENAESLETIRALARDGNGRYYVHCYLGKDRVNVVRRLLEQVDGVATAAPAGALPGARDIAEAETFERGPLYHVGDSVHAGPYPTDEEWVGFVLNGGVRQVVSLLSPAIEQDSLWITRERALATRYQMAVTFLPLVSYPWNPNAALAIARRIRTLPGPVYVHGFRSDRPRLQGVVQAYRSGLPPLPPSLFTGGMERGEVEVIGTNLAVGPRPTGAEFGAYLKPRGVAGIVYVGSGADSAARDDAPIAASVDLHYRAMAGTDPALLRLLGSGGPWYVYGPALEELRPELERRFDTGLR